MRHRHSTRKQRETLNHVEPGITKVYDRYGNDREKREALDAWNRKLQMLVADRHEVNREA